MDKSIRLLNQLVGSAEYILPKGQAAGKKENYSSELDAQIAGEIATITNAMEKMKQVSEPEHDPNMWYKFNGNNVKKRSAEWIHNRQTVQIGGEAAPARQAWQYVFDFDGKTIISNSKGQIEALPVRVNVTVDVSAKTWAHIYDRHYLPTFGGTIEPVNTFWKNDPHAYITGQVGNEMLSSELQLLLERIYSFYKTYDNVDDSENLGIEKLRGADKLFFQGTAKASVEAKSEDYGVEYEVKVTLTSIAPQDADLGYALRPDQL